MINCLGGYFEVLDPDLAKHTLTSTTSDHGAQKVAKNPQQHCGRPVIQVNCGLHKCMPNSTSKYSLPLVSLFVGSLDRTCMSHQKLALPTQAVINTFYVNAPEFTTSASHFLFDCIQSSLSMNPNVEGRGHGCYEGDVSSLGF